jgi:hypothetical protein
LCLNFINFRFAYSHPPLGDFHLSRRASPWRGSPRRRTGAATTAPALATDRRCCHAVVRPPPSPSPPGSLATSPLPPLRRLRPLRSPSPAGAASSGGAVPHGAPEQPLCSRALSYSPSLGARAPPLQLLLVRLPLLRQVASTSLRTRPIFSSSPGTTASVPPPHLASSHAQRPRPSCAPCASPLPRAASRGLPARRRSHAQRPPGPPHRAGHLSVCAATK